MCKKNGKYQWSDEFGEMVCDVLGLDSKNYSRLIIDAQAGKPLKIYLIGVALPREIDLDLLWDAEVKIIP